MDTSKLNFRKPEPRARIKARKDRREAQVISRVRAECQERDGYCRLFGAGLGTCRGESELAHLPQWRRSATRGQPAEQRHTTVGAVMLCGGTHHAALDGRAYPRLYVEHGEVGADGNLIWTCNGVQVRERR